MGVALIFRSKFNRFFLHDRYNNRSWIVIICQVNIPECDQILRKFYSILAKLHIKMIFYSIKELLFKILLNYKTKTILLV